MFGYDAQFLNIYLPDSLSLKSFILIRQIIIVSESLFTFHDVRLKKFPWTRDIL